MRTFETSARIQTPEPDRISTVILPKGVLYIKGVNYDWDHIYLDTKRKQDEKEYTLCYE
jgi:hypothetical protein